MVRGVVCGDGVLGGLCVASSCVVLFKITSRRWGGEALLVCVCTVSQGG
jgi:hypothetical protein